MDRTTIDKTKLNFDSNDPILYRGDFLSPFYHPDLNIGVRLKIKAHSISFSYNNLVEAYLKSQGRQITQNLHFMYGYRFNITGSFYFTPQFFYKRLQTSKTNYFGSVADFSISHFNWGIIYAYVEPDTDANHNLAFYFSGTIFNRVKAGYMYTYTLRNLLSTPQGMHGFMLCVLLGNK